MAVHAAKALDSEEAAQLSWFRAGVENDLLRGKPSELGRGQKVCILAEGRDTAVKRGGCDDRHGREVKKIR
jgi:hypothetical protein